MSSIDTTLLRVLKRRDDYNRMIKSIPTHVLDERTRIILGDYGRFFKEVDDVDLIQYNSFWTWFKMVHPNLNETSKNIYEQLLMEIDTDVPQGLKDTIMGKLVATELSNAALKLIENYNEGAELDIGLALKKAVEDFEQATDRKVKQPWIKDDIGDLLQDDAHDVGLHWRLACLNDSLRPLRPGDFAIVAARPDVGKTTFLTSELTYMASQVDELYPDEDRCILWFNNEGLGKRIVTRLYQSQLDASVGDLVNMNKEGTIKQKYADLTAKGNISRAQSLLRILDVHDFWSHEIEDVIRTNKPALIVFDMVDNIKFGGDANNNGQRTDQLLEAMYQWARVLGVKYDCAILATSQVSADGENMQYPLLGMLKDSKTGKQGAADVIITIGYQADFPDIRYIGTTKNKLAREGSPKSPRAQVVFDGTRGRYRSITESHET